MQREIKFRAWDNHNKKMCQPYFEIKTLETNVCSIEHSPTGGYYMTAIMQFTGLLDKNGKEIYEGDIICASDNKPKGTVLFKNGSFVWSCDELPLTQDGNESIDTALWAKIIGNIYETPDLLK